MTKLRSMAATLVLGALLAVPAMAQTTSATTGTANGPAHPPTPASAPITTNGNAMGNARSTYMTADNTVRASKVIGASVYNDHNEKIGTVDELLMNQNHDITQAVLSVGGFLGIDSKLVAVNIDQLQVQPDRIVMAGATKDGLTKMPTYKFANSAS